MPATNSLTYSATQPVHADAERPADAPPALHRRATSYGGFASRPAPERRDRQLRRRRGGRTPRPWPGGWRRAHRCCAEDADPATSPMPSTCRRSTSPALLRAEAGRLRAPSPGPAWGRERVVGVPRRRGPLPGHPDLVAVGAELIGDLQDLGVRHGHPVAAAAHGGDVPRSSCPAARSVRLSAAADPGGQDTPPRVEGMAEHGELLTEEGRRAGLPPAHLGAQRPGQRSDAQHRGRLCHDADRSGKGAGSGTAPSAPLPAVAPAGNEHGDGR